MKRENILDLLNKPIESLSKEDRHVCQGYIAEQAFAHEKSKRGDSVVMSGDIYDNVKDMIINQKKTEIKCYVINAKDGGFIIDDKQLFKIRNADAAYFITLAPKQLPAHLSNKYESGDVYEIDPKGLVTRESVVIPGKKVIHIDQPAVKKSDVRIDESTMDRIKSYSTSKVL